MLLLCFSASNCVALFISLFLISCTCLLTLTVSLVCLSAPQPPAKRGFTLYSLAVWLLPEQQRDNVGLHDLTCLLGSAGRKLCSLLSAPGKQFCLWGQHV